MRLLQILSLVCIMQSPVSVGQPVQNRMQELLSDSNWLVKNKIQNSHEVQLFYASVNYQSQWTTKDHIDQRAFLFILLHNTAKWGLYHSDYYPELNSEHKSVSNTIDELIADDIRLTDAAIRFYADLKYGNVIPPIAFNEPGYAPTAHDIALQLKQAISLHTLDELAENIGPSMPEIKPILNKIRWFQYILCDTSLTDTSITSKSISVANLPLISKLYRLGYLNSLTENISDSSILKALANAAVGFQLTAKPGVVIDEQLLRQLNIPLYRRLEQLFLSLNYYRWLSTLQASQQVVVVNVPAAMLKVYTKNAVVLNMRMIVGKPTSPTPALLSEVREIVLYPYWMVPLRIATKELLPQIKRNSGFIEAGNFQVLNKAGKIINADSVNWRLYSKTNFPFTIRQSTGCDNALGIIKLNFYNPFGVYLHDTPDKNLFNRSRRFFSHGCMRMEKPFDLAKLLLMNNHLGVDTLDGTCLNNHRPVHIPAEKKTYVLVWYNPAGIDDEGHVQFYEDVYQKFAGKWSPMNFTKRLLD